MDSLIPEEFVGRYVASADMMCATTMICPDESVIRGGVTLTEYARQVDEYNAFQKKRVREQKIDEAKKSPINRLLRWFKKWCGSPVVEIDEYNAFQKKRAREQTIDEAKKSPINRLLRWFKKWCGSPVVEI